MQHGMERTWAGGLRSVGGARSGGRLLSLGSAAAAVVAVSSWAPAVSACSCSVDPMVLPPTGSMSIPRNWQIWGRSLDRDEATGTPSSRLYGPDGEVPSRLRHLAVSDNDGGWLGDFPMLMPNEPLQANTAYRLEPHPWEGYFGHDSPHTFITGDTIDTVRPPAPSVLDITWANDGDPAADCVAGPRVVITLGDVGGLVLMHATPVGSREGDGRGRTREMSWYGYGSQVLLGRFLGCTLGWSQPGPHIFRIAALDPAGLLSDWTELPGPLDLSEPPSANLLAALPVQGNGPKDFARPLFRGEADAEEGAGCALAPRSTAHASRFALTALFALAWLGRRRGAAVLARAKPSH